MAISSKLLAQAALTSSIATIYTVPTGTKTRIWRITAANGTTVGTLTVKVEDAAGSPVSQFLVNGTLLAANNSISIRDLTLEPGWKIRAFATTATGVDITIFGQENDNPPTNPNYKVLGRGTLTGSIADIYTVSVSPAKRSVIQHIFLSNGATAGAVTLKVFDSSASLSRNLLNGKAIAIGETIEEFDIILEQGDKLQASADTTAVCDIVAFGYEMDA